MTPNQGEYPGVDDDEAAFLRKVPHPLIPTNMKGAYSIPAPPDDVDLENASPAELLRHGIYLRKPTADDPSEMRDAWHQFFSRKWLAKDCLVPHLVPSTRRSRSLGRPPSMWPKGTIQDHDWSGAVYQKGKWHGIIGRWTVPSVSIPKEPAGMATGDWESASWIGIDGFGTVDVVSNDVLQVGIEQDVNQNGQASYSAWFEWYTSSDLPNQPSYVEPITIQNFPVSAGHVISATVQYVSGIRGVVSIANETTGRHFSWMLRPPPGATFAGNSVEWIMECPGGGEMFYSIPKFTPVEFTNAIYCGSAIDANLNPDAIELYTEDETKLTSVTLGKFKVTVNFIG